MICDYVGKVAFGEACMEVPNLQLNFVSYQVSGEIRDNAKYLVQNPGIFFIRRYFHLSSKVRQTSVL